MRMFVCISFHYNSERLTYLQQVIKGLNAFPCHIQIVILTNTANHDELRLIQTAANANCHFESKVVNVSNTIHPFILPWAHKAVMKQQFESDESLTEEIIAPFTISGTGKQVRDVLHADDMKRLYMAAVDHIDCARGQAFNVGGGIENSLSLLELFAQLEQIANVKLSYTKLPVRESDQRVFVSDLSKVNLLLGWQPVVPAHEGVARMVGWGEKN
jgi:hypothetical protein